MHVLYWVTDTDKQTTNKNNKNKKTVSLPLRQGNRELNALLMVYISTIFQHSKSKYPHPLLKMVETVSQVKTKK